MIDRISGDTLRAITWQGYQLWNPKKDDIVREIRESRVRFAAVRGVPADICICHEEVVPLIAGEEALWVQPFTGTMPDMGRAVWYIGNLASVKR